MKALVIENNLDIIITKKHMKILINATTLVKGGALQVAVSLIREIKNNGEQYEWFFALSKEVYQELIKFNTIIDMDHTFISDISPARSTSSRKNLLRYVEKTKPDVVFTVFGPAYVRFSMLHLCGVGNGWVTHSTFQVFKKLGNPIKMMRMLCSILYKAYWYRVANAWVVEASVAKNGLIKRLRLPEKDITIVPNNCASQYFDCDHKFDRVWSGEIKILVFSAYYKHKNIDIVPYVAKHIKEIQPDCRFKFVLTLPVDGDAIHSIREKATRLGVSGHIENIGLVPVFDGPDLYRRCHICLHPSLLETFSATYPESMAMRMPIVATDLSFARSVCNTAALYYKPNDARDAAINIVRLIEDELLRDKLIDSGNSVLKTLPTPKEKYLLYLSTINELVRKNGMPVSKIFDQ